MIARRLARLGALVALLMAVLAVSSRAAGQGAQPGSKPPVLSTYEKETLALVLAELRTKIEPAPDGKIVEDVDIVTLEVFDEREGALRILNVLHVTTRPHVVRREILQRVGRPYDRDLVDETARNLRAFPENSLVLVVPVKGSREDTVRVLIVTKDVWSLRLSWDLRAGPAGLDRLVVQPTETNLGGTHQVVAARYIYRPETHTFGAAFGVPRLQGHRLTLAASANVTFNRETGAAEGTFGNTNVARPLFSSRTRWSWFAANNWESERVRRYVDARVALFDARATPEPDGLRDEYDARRFTQTLAVTRSFGIDAKQDFTLGAEVNRSSYSLLTGVTERYPREVVEEYARLRLPVSDTRVGPALRTRFYQTRFSRVLDLETLALQEDVRLGYDLTGKVYPVLEALGSTRSFLGTYAAVQYTWALSDGVVRVGGELLNEFEATRISDAAVSGDLRVHTPSFGFGRLVFDASVLNRYRNHLNRRSLLGGEGRLRGYPTSYFSGKDVLVANLEYRSPAMKIATVFVGAVAFLDAGDAFDGFAELKPQRSAGGGLRILFPQLDRVVFRCDLGFPMVRPLPPGVSPASFFLAFQQAFALSTVGVHPTSAMSLLGQ